MAILPDELWYRILEAGTETSKLGYRDLCCLAIASRRLNRLSLDPASWSTLLARDFSSSSSPSQYPSKSLYKTMFERDKARRLAAQRRKVLNAESQVVMCKKKLSDLESSMILENKRMKETINEIINLEKTRSASVALKVWQPELVRGRQKQLVEQCTVPVESRLDSLKMELRVCKQQIGTFNKAYSKEKERLKEFEEAVRNLKYQPIQSDKLVKEINETKIKRKKLKHHESTRASSSTERSQNGDMKIRDFNPEFF
ncbi:hypothetical protein LUZ60_010963 [Juncus effusus]|nr:hypothetical protein LUZ60_010963 [Juncus effusus]